MEYLFFKSELTLCFKQFFSFLLMFKQKKMKKNIFVMFSFVSQFTCWNSDENIYINFERKI